MQGHLSSLIENVNEMEEARRQRAEIEEWVNSQSTIVDDWIANPSKLRPEAAKQEYTAMNDMMNLIGEKKLKLKTEIANSGRLWIIS